MRKVVAVVFVLALVAVACTEAGEDTESPFHVMVANDDGIDAPGIAAIVKVLAADPSYRVTVVAPAEQQSVSSHSHVTRQEVPLRSHPSLSGVPSWSVGGSPATTVRIGITAVIADDPPDLVVSGINRGENDGLGAWTSGTVGAAREAVLLGYPSVALSLQLDWDDPKPDFDGAARWCKPVLDAVRDRGLPDGVLLNVNVPREISAIRGFRLARMGLTPPSVSRFELVREEAGASWYKSKWRPPNESVEGTDTYAMHHGWVAIAPLALDQTSLDAFSLIQDLEPAIPEQ